jgi:hypothetical protein
VGRDGAALGEVALRQEHGCPLFDEHEKLKCSASSRIERAGTLVASISLKSRFNADGDRHEWPYQKAKLLVRYRPVSKEIPERYNKIPEKSCLLSGNDEKFTQCQLCFESDYRHIVEVSCLNTTLGTNPKANFPGESSTNLTVCFGD